MFAQTNETDGGGGEPKWRRSSHKIDGMVMASEQYTILTTKPMATKVPKTKFKKASCAPKRFKSAFMFYSAKRHREIREQLADKEVGDRLVFVVPRELPCIISRSLTFQKIRAADVAKMVSKSWKLLDKNEKAQWEEMARIDKERYEREKALYTGPWKVPDIKYPDAPKKPMSAFLAFGNERRKAIAAANPLMSNAEISSQLSKLWRECPADVKQSYRDREKRERESFKKYRAEWELMKQREAGVEMPMDKTSCSLVPRPPVSAAAHQFDRNVQNVASFATTTTTSQRPQSEDSDDWEEWMSSSDFEESDSDAGHPHPLNAAISSDIMVTPADPFATASREQQQHPFLPPSSSGSLLFPQLLVTQRLSLDNYTLDALIEDEELFEDFSPLDAPTTAPFVDHSDIESDLSGVVSV